MANVGCKVMAFDPSARVRQPSTSLPNLHYHNLGLHYTEGDSALNPGSSEEEIIRVNNLASILKGKEVKMMLYVLLD